MIFEQSDGNIEIVLRWTSYLVCTSELSYTSKNTRSSSSYTTILQAIVSLLSDTEPSSLFSTQAPNLSFASIDLFIEARPPFFVVPLPSE